MDATTLLTKTVERLKRHEGRYAEICRRAPDISYSWLTKVAAGAITDPKVTSLQQLITALDAFEAANQPAAGEGDTRIEPFEDAP